MALALPQRVREYAEAISAGQYRPTAKAIGDVLRGLLTRGSVHLSNIGRALDERGRDGTPRKLIHTEKRLSHHLAGRRMDDGKIEVAYLAMAAPHLRDMAHPRPTIAVDGSDITKPKAIKMPHLAEVHDGSNDTIGIGWNVLNIEAVGRGGRRLPLLARLYSSVEPGFKSANAVLDSAIERVRPYVPDDAVWALDRGYDGAAAYDILKKHKILFVVRQDLSKKRTIVLDEHREQVPDVVPRIPFVHSFRARRFGPKATRPWVLDVGFLNGVRFPARGPGGTLRAKGTLEGEYTLVVARGIGQEPIVVLTNLPVDSVKGAEEVINAYLDRWGVEEAHRFEKQSFKLEDVRLLTWQGLRRMVLLTMVAYGFMALLAHGGAEVVVEIASAYRSFGKMPMYVFYRLIGGVEELLRGALQQRAP